jgi:hypothetical protein
VNTLRVWLIHRLGGVEKPKQRCLMRTFTPTYATSSGAGIVSDFTTFFCDCPDCKRGKAD